MPRRPRAPAGEPHPCRARLVVVTASDSFSALWPDLAGRLGLDLRLLEQPEPVRGSRCAAVILACGGRETHAVELLDRVHGAGIADVVVVAGEADHRLAVELLRRGASAYYALPGDADRLESELAVRAARVAPPEDGEALAEFQRRHYDFSTILGDAPGLRAALDRAARVIPRGRATVLITGETGTGKELLAQAIHYNGPRAREPFVAVNCSAIPGTLLESELFGHEKGAFTDARASKPGLFEVADGGSLFLDEVASLPLELQGKLLRALETRVIRRVGGVRETTVDVRIVAAANVDLAARVRTGEFRDDLYFRLAVIPIHLPALRERGGDIALLARSFVDHIAGSYDMQPPELTAEAMRALERHAWPGNIRELRNAVERALLLAAGAPIGPEHLALEEIAAGLLDTPPAAAAGGADRLPFPSTLGKLEVAAAARMLELCGGNKSEAARRLGIARARLYRLLERGE